MPKRKLSQFTFPLDHLNHDLLERVLAFLPTAAFFRLNSVCKRWKSAAHSPTFRRACSAIPRRDSWFLMVDSRPQFTHHSVVFDSSENNWKTLKTGVCEQGFIPVAASGGLICFRSVDGADFLVTNPVNSSSRRINSPFPNNETLIWAIAMVSNTESFSLVLISGDLPNLKFRRFSSASGEWEPEIALTRKSCYQSESETAVVHEDNDDDDDCTQYFLTKCGNVVSTDIQRSPAKQYSSILMVKDDGDGGGSEEVLYFISSAGRVVACNLTRRFFFEYPRLLPIFSEYSIDLVECGGQLCVVLLSEFRESSSLRVWVWDEDGQYWRQKSAMPPAMVHRFDGKKADINCGGGGDGKMMVCVNWGEDSGYVMCDLGANEWVELEGLKGREFVCGFPFEPRIEAFA